MKKKFLTLLLSGIILIGAGHAVPAMAATNGWALNADYKWSYYDNGQRVTGWIRPDGYNWYYLNSNGDMLTGLQKIDGKWYLLYQGQYSREYEGSMEFDNTVGPYYFGGDGALYKISSGALSPDDAYKKLENYFSKKGYDVNDEGLEVYYSTAYLHKNKLIATICNKSGTKRFITGAEINLLTGFFAEIK